MTDDEKCAMLSQICRTFAECGEQAERTAQGETGNARQVADLIATNYRLIYSQSPAVLALALRVLADLLPID